MKDSDEARPVPVATVIARYASSRYYAQLLGMLTAFLRPKLLTPEQFGLWSLLMVIPNYASYSHLGTQSSLRYLIPFYRAKRADTELADARNTTFGVSMAGNLMVSLVLLLVSCRSGLDLQLRAGLWTMALVVMLQALKDFHVTLLKADERFSVISASNYVEATCTLLLTVPLLYFFRLYGLYVTLAFTFVPVLTYFWRRQTLNVRMHLQWHAMRDLVVQGLPIMISGLAIVLITTSDRLVISYFLGMEAVGYYAIAAMIAGFLMQLPGIAREVLEPQMMKSVAEQPPDVVTDEYLLRPLVNTAYLAPFLIGPVFLALPAAIALVLPRYTASVVPARILVLGVYFAALSHGPRMFVVARKWQMQGALLMLVAVGANVAMNVIFIALGYGLAGVAVGSSVAYLLLCVAMLVFIARKLPSKSAAWRRHAPAMLLPFPLMCASLALLRISVPMVVGNLFLDAALSTIVFTGAMVAFYRLARKKLPLLKGFEL